MIYVSCELWAPVRRFDVYDYVRGLELSVYTQEEDEKILLGRYHAELLLLSEAESDGMSLHEVCDTHSGDMEHLYCSLFEPKDEEFQPELELDEFTDSVLFLWDSVLHPKLKAYEAGILETVGTLFGNEAVLVLHRDTTSLTDKELTHSGFAKITGTNYIFRHTAVLSPFNQEYPQGVDVPLKFTASKDDERWVRMRLSEQ
ncbi:hypothetical protein [Gimesia sp.]|uniref:hypothetical protein n=1 Tax=Gimesia sp. TaxID=2024833 RepID=UPI003A921BC3